jgi:hypothetical protein
MGKLELYHLSYIRNEQDYGRRVSRRPPPGLVTSHPDPFPTGTT